MGSHPAHCGSSRDKVGYPANYFSNHFLQHKLSTVGWDLCLLEFKHLFAFDFWPSVTHPASIQPPRESSTRAALQLLLQKNRVTSEDELESWSFSSEKLLCLAYPPNNLKLIEPMLCLGVIRLMFFYGLDTNLVC